MQHKVVENEVTLVDLAGLDVLIGLVDLLAHALIRCVENNLASWVLERCRDHWSWNVWSKLERRWAHREELRRLSCVLHVGTPHLKVLRVRGGLGCGAGHLRTLEGIWHRLLHERIIGSSELLRTMGIGAVLPELALAFELKILAAHSLIIVVRDVHHFHLNFHGQLVL